MTRQTKTFLLERFREMGIRPATRHGQNFLVDLNLVEIIVDSAELTSDDVVLEVGTGTGSLTAMMAARAAEIVTVEIDPHLYELASEQLIDLPNVTMLRLDVLRNKNTIDDRVMDAVGERLAAAPGRRFKLVANLPYNIATPLLSNLLLARHVPHSMTVTIQKELAERITAMPSTKDYSATQRMDSKPVQRRNRPHYAAERILASTEGLISHFTNRCRQRPTSPNRRLAIFSPDDQSVVFTSTQISPRQCGGGAQTSSQ